MSALVLAIILVIFILFYTFIAPRLITRYWAWMKERKTLRLLGAILSLLRTENALAFIDTCATCISGDNMIYACEFKGPPEASSCVYPDGRLHVHLSFPVMREGDNLIVKLFINIDGRQTSVTPELFEKGKEGDGPLQTIPHWVLAHKTEYALDEARQLAFTIDGKLWAKALKNIS